MIVLVWVDQTAFGPFETNEAAIQWAETAFGASWANLSRDGEMYTLAVEKPK